MFHLEFEVLGNQFGLAELVPPSSPSGTRAGRGRAGSGLAHVLADQ